MPFQKGISGNPAGRQVGSRNRLAEKFLNDLYADWNEHGAKAIAEVREKYPTVYLRVVASVLPREMHVKNEGILQELSDEELNRLLSEVRGVVATRAPALSGEGADTPPSSRKPH
jgi:hypothetical protein